MAAEMPAEGCRDKFLGATIDAALEPVVLVEFDARGQQRRPYEVDASSRCRPEQRSGSIITRRHAGGRFCGPPYRIQ